MDWLAPELDARAAVRIKECLGYVSEDYQAFRATKQRCEISAMPPQLQYTTYQCHKDLEELRRVQPGGVGCSNHPNKQDLIPQEGSVCSFEWQVTGNGQASQKKHHGTVMRCQKSFIHDTRTEFRVCVYMLPGARAAPSTHGAHGRLGYY